MTEKQHEEKALHFYELELKKRGEGSDIAADLFYKMAERHANLSGLR